MLFSHFKLLKFVYRGILTGMPITTYNPITKNNFHAPMTVLPDSTYINFKLNSSQTAYLNDYIQQFNNSLEIIPINIYEYEKPSNYLSINVYNCSSPLFGDDKKITRCEINTYVKDKYDNIGTLIIDYTCSDLSMDPVNIFKFKSKTEFYKYDLYHCINCESPDENINLSLNFTGFRCLTHFKDGDDSSEIKISENLLDYTDNVFYKNGILDKVYYDSTLTRAKLCVPQYVYNLSFVYKDLIFDDIDSIFYFTNKINFVGGMWNNIYDIENQA